MQGLINSIYKNRFVLPWFRLFRNLIKYRYALIRASFGSRIENHTTNTLFIIGCGRSGTTILGKVLESHPDVYYFFEPWHLWAAVDSRLDLTNLHTGNEVDAIFDETSFTTTAQIRFEKLFYGSFRSDRHKTLIEKTPHNALRIGYLDKLARKPTYLHIVRDGIDVVKSIDQIASKSTYQIATMPHFNQWWGNNSCKWEAIKRHGKKVGFYADEVDQLTTHKQKGAYEWLLSLHEVDKHREALGARLLEIKYADLVAETEMELLKISSHFELEQDTEWLRRAANMIRQKDINKTVFEALGLPPKICRVFNDNQERYGFLNRAVVL